jgi:drug/metabolite transporter (DMT)-like permease
LRELAYLPKAAIYIGLAAGWANLSYVLAVLEGEVMRVLLLFYLAPLWTLFLARWLLAERAGTRGWMVMLLSLAGMFTMLWQGGELPLPQNGAEWLALSAGMAFAATNVLTRRAGHLSLQIKSLAVWAGACAIALIFFVIEKPSLPSPATIGMANWLLMAAMGALLAATTWLVQLGVTHTPANRAAMIFMFELVVAAVSSYFLAGEAMTPREWVGGTMIIAAALLSEN